MCSLRENEKKEAINTNNIPEVYIILEMLLHSVLWIVIISN